jgi:hypothetical protein
VLVARYAEARLVSSSFGVLSELPKMNEGAIAQLGERLPCTQEVNGSIPFGSTTSLKMSVAEIRREFFTSSIRTFDDRRELTSGFNNPNAL